VANFNDKTVDELRAALAELLKCKWRYDQEGEYWLLYAPEETRSEEMRLISEKETKEHQGLEQRIADNALSLVVADILKEVDPAASQRIRAGLAVDVPLETVPRTLWGSIADSALFDPRNLGRRQISVTGFDPTSDDLRGGWLEFQPRPDGAVWLFAVLDFETGDRATGTHRTLRARTQLGPVLWLSRPESGGTH
jgi:hypothetical protein